MATTEKNILNNWFRTGAKPTQEQFWNWQDSYWHKTDTIPQAQIQNLDKTLENKADTSALDAKANADATDLGEANVLKWKEALGVGEVPDNMATIDKDGKLGNVYDKTQVDDLLESSGKNIGNSDLETTDNRTFTQAHIYTHATAGYPYYVTGLPDKSSDTAFNLIRVQKANGENALSNGKAVLESLFANLPDVSSDFKRFPVYPVFNPETNTLAKSIRPQAITNFNVPENIRITQDVNMPGVVVNPKPEYSDDLKRALNKIREIQQLGFTKVRKDELVVKIMEEQFFPEQMRGKYTFPNNLIEKPEDGCFIFNGFGNLYLYEQYIRSIQHTNYLDNNNAKAFYNVFINKEMPSDKDWIIKVRTHSNYNNYSSGNKGHSIGFKREISNYADYNFNESFIRWGGSGSVDVNTLFTKKSSYYDISLFTEIYCMKQGNLILTLILDIVSNRYSIEVNSYTEEYKKLYFYINPNYYGFQRGQVIFKDISYWIEP